MAIDLSVSEAFKGVQFHRKLNYIGISANLKMTYRYFLRDQTSEDFYRYVFYPILTDWYSTA